MAAPPTPSSFTRGPCDLSLDEPMWWRSPAVGAPSYPSKSTADAAIPSCARRDAAVSCHLPYTQHDDGHDVDAIRYHRQGIGIGIGIGIIVIGSIVIIIVIIIIMIIIVIIIIIIIIVIIIVIISIIIITIITIARRLTS
jgi:hypothetical protein